MCMKTYLGIVKVLSTNARMIMRPILYHEAVKLKKFMKRPVKCFLAKHGSFTMIITIMN